MLEVILKEMNNKTTQYMISSHVLALNNNQKSLQHDQYYGFTLKITSVVILYVDKSFAVCILLVQSHITNSVNILKFLYFRISFHRFIFVREMKLTKNELH